jgi:type 1 glutamine amidotransferase
VSWTHATSNREAFQKDIRLHYDVVVLYDLSKDLDESGKRNLRGFLGAGKGLLVLHHALADYNNWEWWWREVVGGKYILPEGDKPASSYQHDVELFVEVAADHPITRGLGPMHLIDETYKNMWISPDSLVLLETDEKTSDGPVAWISPFRESRVVVIQLGHDRRAHTYPGFRQLVKRSLLWAGERLE